MSSKIGTVFRRLSPATRLYSVILLGRIALYMGLGWRGARPWAEEAKGAQIALAVLPLVLGLAWLHSAWRRIPEPCRRTYDDREMVPGEVIFRLFIPFYNLYWIFIANVGLCGAIERQARRARIDREAPSSLAMAACFVQIIPVVGLLFGPLFWCIFMIRIDLLHADIEDKEAASA